MTVRTYLLGKIDELQDEILKMGSFVEEELKLAFEALDDLDLDLVNKVCTVIGFPLGATTKYNFALQVFMLETAYL